MAAHCVSRRGALAATGCIAAAMLVGCARDARGPQPGSSPLELSDVRDEAPARSLAENKLADMTLGQKVAQLFIVTPESLTGVDTATIAGGLTRAALEQYPVGGLCYFGRNIAGNGQLRDMLAGTREMCRAVGAGIEPFLTIDEEGGPLVARVANSGYFEVEHFPNMADVGASGDPAHAAHVGASIGSYLHEIGFSVDFAPDADVLTNPGNTVIGPRSFGSDPQLVADMVAAEVAAMLETDVLPCIKHFPGHGDTAGDSHTGAVYAERTRFEIEACELLPFKSGIEAGCPLVMVGHIETPNFAADGLPASLSKTMMSDVLRGDLGFEGVIVSDSFAMGAITENYTPADAAVRYIQAGGDVLLMPESLEEAYHGVLSAVEAGEIAEERLDESVLRVLELKERAGLLS